MENATGPYRNLGFTSHHPHTQCGRPCRFEGCPSIPLLSPCRHELGLPATKSCEAHLACERRLPQMQRSAGSWESRVLKRMRGTSAGTSTGASAGTSAGATGTERKSRGQSRKKRARVKGEPEPAALRISPPSAEMGRSLVAARYLQAGEVLMRCLPWCAVVADEHVGKRCAGCLRSLGGLQSKVCPHCETALCAACAAVSSSVPRAADLMGTEGAIPPSVIHADECAALARLRAEGQRRRQQQPAAPSTGAGADITVAGNGTDASTEANADADDTSLLRALIRMVCWLRRQRERTSAREADAFMALEHHWARLGRSGRRRMHRLATRALRLLDIGQGGRGGAGERGREAGQPQPVCQAGAAASAQLDPHKVALVACRLFVNSMSLTAEGAPEQPQAQAKTGSVAAGGALTFGDQTTIGVALFGHAALLNHSCAPNATWHIEWHPQIQSNQMQSAQAPLALTVRATRSIRANEHVLISYINLCQHTEARRAELAANFFFRCECTACSDCAGLHSASPGATSPGRGKAAIQQKLLTARRNP